MKKIITFTLLTLSLSCSSNINLEEDFLQESNKLEINSSSFYPLTVSFNNAYKGLADENDKIGRSYDKNPDKYFIPLIDSAKKTIDGAFYDIGDPEVVNAFIRAHKRGVKVRLITDDANLKDKDDPTLPRQSIITLKEAGVTVKDDKRSQLMHHKFMVVDNTTVWTGSWNLTTSSMFQHNNNCLMIRSEKLAENFNAEFKRMYEDNMFGPNSHNMPYSEVIVSNSSIKTYFSPGGGTTQAIINELQKATKSIKFMAFSMTDKDISLVLQDKKKQGLKVEGVFDNCLIPQYSIYWDLRKSNILSLRDGNQALMHHKVMIIDDQTVITGSFNFSKSADQQNNENCLIIKSENIAKLYNSEYLRIRSAAFNNKDLPPYDHPACEKEVKKSKEFPPTPPVNSSKPNYKFDAE